MSMDPTTTVFNILRTLKDMNFIKSMHQLEEESKVFFDLKYFEELFLRGDWDECTKYFSAFTSFEQNPFVFSQILNMKHKDIVGKFEEEQRDVLFAGKYPRGMTLQGGNTVEDTRSLREENLELIMMVIQASPCFENKLEFPQLKTSAKIPRTTKVVPSKVKIPSSGLTIASLQRTTRSSKAATTANPVADVAVPRQTIRSRGSNSSNK